ncbi:MAG: Rieske (2Fe-2S) protein [Gammaproteobacteria bacterium]|nr:Rieske 2Fe-2S domain-containing protein [Gammaproteobacteria bacterium]
MRPVQDQALCVLDTVPRDGTRGFLLETPRGSRELFLVRRGPTVYAYLNCCPHTGAPLNWLPDQFLNRERTLIQCANHDALFRIEDGYCVHGPCHGRSLIPVDIAVRDGHVVLLDPSVHLRYPDRFP